jgi:D-glycero-alpha-D-manno-heptose-7-phosphate kinase
MLFISKTPLRVSLFGGGTDFPEYFKYNKGAVLGFAINKYIYTYASLMHDSVESNFRISYKKMESVNRIEDINHPIIKAVLKQNSFITKDKWHFGTLADVPAGTGLGSSSAFTVSFIKLVDKIKNKKKSKLNLAKYAHYIERNLLKESVGLQDPFHTSFGGINLFRFYKDKILNEKIIISKNKLQLINNSLMLCYFGNTRKSSKISSSHIDKIKKGVNKVYLNDMYKSVNEAKKILNNMDGNKMLIELGKLLNINWHLKKKLSNNVSNKKIDELISFGISNGAYGAKLCGAGSGGFILFLIDKKLKNKLNKKLSPKYPCMDINVDFEGAV